ncbi:hypothetical protein [Nonomuraea typhae]|uniref:hypothetical protein n=1 Tax=Nonomuraea typhae TaxID=2603600 RepID=UPI0012F99274|nr:hypothetical protein [Nonomuraea typhae]
MDADEREARRVLAPLRESASGQDGPGVSVAAAMAAGRRRIRMRRAIGASVAAAAVAVIVPAVVLTRAGDPPGNVIPVAQPAEGRTAETPATGEPGTSPAAEEPGATPSPSLSTTPPPELFQPGSRPATVGSAGGFTPESDVTHRDRQRVTLRLDTPRADDRGDAIIEIYPGDQIPPTLAEVLPAAPGAPVTKAPPVHEGAAYWLDEPVLRPGATELAWQWKPGAWAVVSVTGTRADRDNVHRVAQSVLPS